jgi:hypothetical protein
MEKYIEIIKRALDDAINETHNDPFYLDEEATLKIIAVVDAACGYIAEKWFDYWEHIKFINLINEYRENSDIIKMREQIDEHHKKQADECEKDPAWKKFDNGIGNPNA